MAPGESWANVGAGQHAFRLRTQTRCGHPESETTTGLVACRRACRGQSAERPPSRMRIDFFDIPESRRGCGVSGIRELAVFVVSPLEQA